MKRNRNLRDRVYLRDLGLCRCCGFKGDEVHHITPLVYNGEDTEENMVVLCGTCHKGAPDSKEEFDIYVKKGGKKHELLLGKLAIYCIDKDLNFSEVYVYFKKMLNCFKQVDITNAIESFNLKTSVCILENTKVKGEPFGRER